MQSLSNADAMRGLTRVYSLLRHRHGAQGAELSDQHIVNLLTRMISEQVETTERLQAQIDQFHKDRAEEEVKRGATRKRRREYGGTTKRRAGYIPDAQTVERIPPPAEAAIQTNQSESEATKRALGRLFTFAWAFPRGLDSNDVMVIAGPRGKKTVDRRLKRLTSGPEGTPYVEVAVAGGTVDALRYLGSFKPEVEWLSFTEDNVGDIHALLNDWAGVSDPERIDKLRRRISSENDLRYCILKHAHFNSEYFETVKGVLTPHAVALSCRLSPRKRKRDE